jgi:hypothetical protein
MSDTEEGAVEESTSPQSGQTDFNPEVGQIMFAPPRHNQFGEKVEAEVVHLHFSGAEPMAEVREPDTEAEPWSVHKNSLESLPEPSGNDQ